MNAAVADIEDRHVSLGRKIHGMERSWLESRLNEWGHWIEQNSDYEGYPRSDAVRAALEGAGGGTSGHRILCPIMPKSILKTHLRVLELGEEDQVTVWAEYVPRAKEDGTTWTRAEKCKILGIADRTYQHRLQHARLRILGLIGK